MKSLKVFETPEGGVMTGQCDSSIQGELPVLLVGAALVDNRVYERSLPVLVASLAAVRRGSYLGLKATVKALSIILPPICVPKSAIC